MKLLERILRIIKVKLLKGANAILVPGGFGDRGVEGKILASRYSRANRIPFLGICLGMQIAVIEFVRPILGLLDTNSTEFDPDIRILVSFLCQRVQQLIWVVQCVLDIGEHILKLRIVNLQNYMATRAL